jgi:phosphinothricin acetyltransferase
MVPHVRPATAADLTAVARIYDHYVLHTAVTFDTSPKPVSEWEAAFQRDVVEGPYDFLVAELDGEVAAYAHTYVFNQRCAYETSLTVSVYTAPAQVGRALGRALYAELFERVLPGRGFHRAYGGVALPNPASVALHEAFGFVQRAHYTEVGRKLDRWWDVVWFEKALD